jgi:hypothetical protein
VVFCPMQSILAFTLVLSRLMARPVDPVISICPPGSLTAQSRIRR